MDSKLLDMIENDLYKLLSPYTAPEIVACAMDTLDYIKEYREHPTDELYLKIYKNIKYLL